MKRLFSFSLCLLAFLAVRGQAYYYTTLSGTSAPYAYNATGTNLITTGDQVLSSWQTLPFTWNFYGSAVTGYYASDNGYITFDNTASTSIAANAALPAAGGPGNSIFAFWDDFTVNSASANPDLVRSWTYGTAPNRVHCIQWWSMTPVANNSSWIYATIRIYEAGDFDIVLDYSAASAAAATSGTIGCQNGAGNDGTDVATSPAYSYATLTTAATDDIVYKFVYGTQLAYDASVTASGLNGTCAIGNNTVSGTLTNLGSTTLTDLRLNYRVDGGATVSANLTSLNIAGSGGTYAFSHPTPWNVATGGQTYTLEIWADNLNGSNPDGDMSNDTLAVSLLSTLGITAPKAVLIEEFTGAWCQFCPDGVVVLDQLETAHPNDVNIVSVHDGDAMEFAEGIRTGFSVSSYPSANIDRWLFPAETKIPVSRSNWSSYTTQRLNAETPVEVTVDVNFDLATNVAAVTVTADFVDYAVGDLRIGLMVTEDDVTGTGAGYNQVNYYNTVAGHPYFGAGNPIVGFVHNHVLRQHDGNPFGQSGIIPSTANPGSSYTYTENITIPAAWDVNKVHFVGYVYRYESNVLEGEVLNSGSTFILISGVNDPVNESEGLLSVNPNPSTGLTWAELTFAQPTEAVVEVYNLTGQKVATLKEGNFSAGSHRVYMDVTEQEAGVYFVTVKTADRFWTQKLVVTH